MSIFDMAYPAYWWAALVIFIILMVLPAVPPLRGTWFGKSSDTYLFNILLYLGMVILFSSVWIVTLILVIISLICYLTYKFKLYQTIKNFFTKVAMKIYG
jgi:hypothetical protein